MQINASNRYIIVAYTDGVDSLTNFQFVVDSAKTKSGLHVHFKDKVVTKRIIAAVLAFPFPFGVVGLHRIYMGTKPYVPVTYIASLGGIFGVLPLIDFFTIICHKNYEQLENNGKIFMWIKD